MVKDKDGNNFMVSNDDPRYVNGDLVGITKGKTNYKDKDGNIFMVSVDDPRVLSGELIGLTKGSKQSEEAKRKISQSLMGNSATKGYKWIHNIYEKKLVPENKLQDFLACG